MLFLGKHILMKHVGHQTVTQSNLGSSSSVRSFAWGLNNFIITGSHSDTLKVFIDIFNQPTKFNSSEDLLFVNNSQW